MWFKTARGGLLPKLGVVVVLKGPMQSLLKIQKVMGVEGVDFGVFSLCKGRIFSFECHPQCIDAYVYDQSPNPESYRLSQLLGGKIICHMGFFF